MQHLTCHSELHHTRGAPIPPVVLPLHGTVVGWDYLPEASPGTKPRPLAWQRWHATATPLSQLFCYAALNFDKRSYHSLSTLLNLWLHMQNPHYRSYRAGTRNMMLTFDSRPIYRALTYIAVLFLGPQQPRYIESTLYYGFPVWFYSKNTRGCAKWQWNARDCVTGLHGQRSWECNAVTPVECVSLSILANPCYLAFITYILFIDEIGMALVWWIWHYKVTFS